jgi:hypothetical protein
MKAQKILQSGDVLKSAVFNMDIFTQIVFSSTKEFKLYYKRAELLILIRPVLMIGKDDNGQFDIEDYYLLNSGVYHRYLVIQVN